jgi:hypothetical protein
MTRGWKVSPVIKIACPARSALPNARCVSGRQSSRCRGPFAAECHPERAAAAASAR